MAVESILWLGDSRGEDARVTGGKAANLSRLAARYRVPPGFSITTGAFPDTLDTTDSLPEELRREIATAYALLGDGCGVAEPSVAVRSSAVDEDGGDVSFAGQHETYLNVTGADAVADAVVRCWQSLHGARALEYRRLQGRGVEGARLAVLVQQLVPAEVSGVVFSANPINSSRAEAVVTASWGLGESIVSGAVTPDTYIVRKADLAVLMRHVGDKRVMTVPIPGGTRQVDVPPERQDQPALGDADVVEAVRLAISLEETMGWPVDIECAWYAGILYLLQCRPITTLK